MNQDSKYARFGSPSFSVTAACLLTPPRGGASLCVSPEQLPVALLAGEAPTWDRRDTCSGLTMWPTPHPPHTAWFDLGIDKGCCVPSTSMLSASAVFHFCFTPYYCGLFATCIALRQHLNWTHLLYAGKPNFYTQRGTQAKCWRIWYWRVHLGLRRTRQYGTGECIWA